MAIQGQINKLQWFKAKWNAGMTDSNNLAQALLTKPEISQTLAHAFGTKYYLQYLTMGTGRVANKYKPIGNVEYMWPLMGYLTRPITITADITYNANDTPGLNFSTFRVSLAERWYDVGDVLVFDSRANLCRVQTEPTQIGNSYIYVLQLVTNDPAEFVDPDDLTPGKQVIKEFTNYEEGSEGGFSNETTPFWFKNQLSTARKSYSMTGSALTDVMILKLHNGQSLWFYEKEWQFMQQWQQEAERMRWYGKYNRTSAGEVHLPGKNGRPVLSGDGILEQIAYTNRRSYTVLTETLLQDFMIDLMLMSKDSDHKKFIAFCGIGFMDEFNKAMKNALGRYVVEASDVFVSGSGNDLTFKGQFNKYYGLNGIELSLVHNPIFDDPQHNRELHPITGRPIESYRAVFLDFGMYDGESNISMITKGTDGINRSMMMWYVAGGALPPSGDAGVSKLRASGKDSFECHYLSETGIKVLNPLSCGELRCVLQ